MFYVIATSLLTLILPFFGLGSFIYFTSAYLLGGLFIFYVFQLMLSANVQSAWRLFKYSLLYLALLFTALVIDHMTLI
jgi:protoheme IX farnesyltransferase